MTNKKAIIIGGSLGGMFTAAALRAGGWEVEVYERSAHALGGRGGGIVLQPDTIRALQYAGVQRTAPLGVASGDRIYLDRNDAVVQRSHMPQSQTSWNMVYGALCRHVPKSVVFPGHEFVMYSQDDSKVTAFFANGHQTTGDILIGADGFRSAVREQMLPGLRPAYAGYVAWRGLVPELELSERAADVLRGTFAFQQGHEHLFLEYLVPGEDESVEPGRRRWNWVWYRKVAEGAPLQRLLTDREGAAHQYSLPPGGASDEVVADLLEASFGLLAPTFQDVVTATSEPFVQSILDFQTPQMVDRRVALVGDSAFIPRPHTAGSTAKAAANAMVLAQMLRRYPDNEVNALQAYAEAEHSDGMHMSQWGIQMGDRIMNIHRSPPARA